MTEDQNAGLRLAGPGAVITVLTPMLSFGATVILLAAGYVAKVLGVSELPNTLIRTGWYFGALTAAALAIGFVTLLIVAIRNREVRAAAVPDRRRSRPQPQSGIRMASFASLIAGRRRPHLREEWAAILAGDPENGLPLSKHRALAYAAGFVWAALRLRARDVTAPFWIPVDWVLATEKRTNAFIATVVGVQAVLVVGHDGVAALVTDIWKPCGTLGSALYVFTRWLRRVRGIELAASRNGTPDS
ncbi:MULTISPECIES: hypothetical protein [Streptomyces]|uniref:Uncharacterized protein n=1 Tax=Streptomyces ehimensis TaxID=68195 RepID=A0ABV9BEK4_9ACTN